MSSQSELPRVLLISDATLSHDGGGINRTLANLFSDYPIEKFRLCAPLEYLPGNPPVERFAASVIPYRLNLAPEMRNRLGAKIAPLRMRLNLQLLSAFDALDMRAITAFSPEVIVSCTNYLEGCVVANRIVGAVGCPAIFYAMDEFGERDTVRWIGGSGRGLVTKSLATAAGWMFISEELRDYFTARYGQTERATAIVRNVVDVAPDRVVHNHSGTFTIAYAGSIWPMHLDSLDVVAQAVSELKRDGADVKLLIYAPEKFWAMFGGQLERSGVEFAGFIPYEALHATLNQCDLLLVCSSFQPVFEHISRTSFQTKLPDYFASGSAVLAHGPRYSICNRFIEEHGCGISCNSDDPVVVAQLLKQVTLDRGKLAPLAERGLNVAREEFDRGSGQRRLYQFLLEMAHGRN